MAKLTEVESLGNNEVNVPLTSEVSDTSNKKAPCSSASNTFVPPDGGWGWVVCISSLWTNGTVFGIINTFGIVYVYMRKEFAHDDPTISFKTSFVGSACTGITFLMCIVASICSDRFGIRQTAFIGGLVGFIGLLTSAFVEQLELLYLTYGVFLGLGSALAYSPSLVILGHYFKKHMGLVNGIVSFGSAIFTIILSIVLPILLEKIKIRYTFLFLSGLEFTLMICAWTWKPLLHKESKFINVKIWKNKAYVIWAVSCSVCLFGYFVPIFHLVKHTKDIFPESDGSMLVLCLSITSGISRIAFGKLADIKCVSLIRMQQIAFVIMGAATTCIPLSSSFEGLIGICLVMGVSDGIFICLMGPIAFDIVGPHEASQAIGFLFGIFSIPFTVGPPIAGLLYDHLGSYQIAFYAAGVPPVVGAIFMFFIPKVTQVFSVSKNTDEFASISILALRHADGMKASSTTTDTRPHKLPVDASEWTIDGVIQHISETDPALVPHTELFNKQKIHGKALLLLNREVMSTWV